MGDFTFSLLPPPGINSDDSAYAATGQWTDCDGIRFVGGRPQTYGSRIANYFTGCGPGVSCMLAAPFPTDDVTLVYLVTASTTKLGAIFLGSSGDVTDITPSPAPDSVTMKHWSLQMWGADLLASPTGGGIYVWTGDTSSRATAISGPPAAITAMLVSEQQRQVIAFGCNEEASGTFNPRCIRWSDFEDYSDWVTTATNNAGEFILDGVGSLVAARHIGAYIAIWTDEGLFIGQFIGDPSQTYRFDRVSTGCGLVSPRAVAVVDSTAYWVSHDLRLYQWTPGALPAPVPCPIGVDFAQHCADRPSITVGTVRRYSEIWIFYSDNRDGAPSGIPVRHIIYSVGESEAAQRPVWSRGRFGRTAVLDDGIVHAFFPAQAAPVLMATEPDISSGSVDMHELIDPSAPYAWFLQSGDQYINEGRTRVMIKSVTPDFEQQTGSVSLTLFMRDRPQSTAVTKGPYTLAAAAGKKDFRASGKVVAVKLSGLAGTAMRLGKPSFDCVTGGGR